MKKLKSFKEYESQQAQQKMVTNPTFVRINNTIKEFGYRLSYAYVDSITGKVNLKAIGEIEYAPYYPDIYVEDDDLKISTEASENQFDLSSFKRYIICSTNCFKAAKYINMLKEEKVLSTLAILEN